ncbi:FAD-dependent oxidoreductase [Tsukamurella sp. 8F]|uniref:FAD-dependent oxidoreductase n=1 Tax=unclassified Tsukamurella TaxID=2633480 RepID=UPI0023BA1699|nr:MULTISPECIES: FAD-dependent oxidoreductase [unclassified Tsukamurella]MDF0529429.1 FAD-dependent oxidoreductase [Tsukamurella sp. 8J]MDF0587064.1 FAD-dependent oxidoreductase [Tsukamurella sp. 8F]
MTHIITQPCCNDASCVVVCPVNCIHPTPDEPGFATAEMLYIDPETCIDCGACIEECPVEAIVPDYDASTRQEPYLQINADFYLDHDVAAGLEDMGSDAPPPAADLHVAIVGAGPAALYAAEELVRYPAVKVDAFDRLPTPYGLVRAGVAPDHPSTKGVERTFVATAGRKNFEYFLDVEVGRDVTLEELRERYHAVLYASGAPTDRRLGIEGEELPGSVSATDFVAWYNCHPEHVSDRYDLSARRAVVVGNGNVALDVARILLTHPDQLAGSDIADHALGALRESGVEEVVVLGRRGIAEGAYTNAEFLAMGSIDGVDVVIDEADLVLDPATAAAETDGTLDSTVATKIRLARELAARPAGSAPRRIVFRYLTAPVRILGDDRVYGVRCVRNAFTGDGHVRATDETFDLEAGAVVRAIGYRGTPVPGLPFDEVRSVVPNVAGRVTDEGAAVPGVYVAGWLKRGATGGIGMNRWCGHETAHSLLTDFAAGLLPPPVRSRDEVPGLLAERGVARVDDAGWRSIDSAEKAAGRAAKRPRVKLADVQELLRAAGIGSDARV